MILKLSVSRSDIIPITMNTKVQTLSAVQGSIVCAIVWYSRSSMVSFVGVLQWDVPYCITACVVDSWLLRCVKDWDHARHAQYV